MTSSESSATPPEPPETDAVAATPPAPAAAAPAAVPEPRPWWRRLRRASQATPPDRLSPEEVPAPPAGSSPGLLQRNPFQVGFFLTLGGMTAFILLNALVTLQSIVILGILALFVALGLNPSVEWLHRRGAPRGLAVALVALTMVLLVALGAWAVLPVVTEQVNNLVLNAPAYLQALRENPQVAELDAQIGIINRTTQLLTSGTWAEGLFGGILGASRAVANIVFSAIVTLVLTLYFLASLPAIKNTIYQLAPASRRPRVKYLADEMFVRIGGYMTGLFIVVTCAATTAFIFLNIVGLSAYALALSVVVAGFAFIPLVGSTLSMIIVSIVALSLSPTTGIITLVFFLCYQQIDTYLIQPRVFQRSMSVPGVLVILAAISGGFLFGIAGALLAMPITASLLLLYREVLVPRLDRL